MTRTYRIGRLGFGFCTEREQVVREDGSYTFWMLWKRGSRDVYHVSTKDFHVYTHFPWGSALKRHNEMLADSKQYRDLVVGEVERIREDRYKELAEEAIRKLGGL